VSSTDATGGASAEREAVQDAVPDDAMHAHLDFRQERVRVETSRHRIAGLMTLARDGYRSRISDVLNASERDFLTLTEVSVEPLDGGPVESHSFLAVARAHIVFAVSAAAPPGEPPAEPPAGPPQA
jgi:hypothetical protein